jgi:ABC-type lipoprotein export system ATPase subunit
VLTAHEGVVASASSLISTKKSTASAHAFGRRATARNHRSSLRRPAQPRVANEPTGSLDRSIGRKIVESLRSTATLPPATLLVVTHDEEVAQKADRRLEIEGGVLRESA